MADRKAFYCFPTHIMAEKMTKNNKALAKLEKDIVKNQSKKSQTQLDEEERAISEKPIDAAEGLGIQEEEAAGQEPYPEIEKALKDPDEEEDEDKLD